MNRGEPKNATILPITVVGVGAHDNPSYANGDSNGCLDDAEIRNGDIMLREVAGSGIVRNLDTEGGLKQEPEREQWSGHLDFLLSIIGFAVDLANVWRFPYLCYKNGGGAFLVPYVIMLICIGVPLLYLELALGQYNKAGAVGIWKMVPFLKGTGYASILVCFYVSFYYPAIIGYAFYYLFASFNPRLPWSHCDNPWNTPGCIVTINSTLNGTAVTNSTGQVATASEEFFTRRILGLHQSEGFHHFTDLKWDIALCSLLVYVILFFSLARGVKTSGKVVWVTALLPYVLLFVLLIQAVLLPGAKTGILYYITPRFEKIKSLQVWYDAAIQILYSSGPGFGVHIAYASYNKFHNNIQRDAIITSIVNSLTSFFAGFVVFAFLGYMSFRQGVSIDKVAQDGPGLVFIVYPEALSLLKGGFIFSIIFFITLVSLGFDSQLGGMESVLTGINDDFGGIMRRKKIPKILVTGVVIGLSFLIGLLCSTKSGIYWVTFFDVYSAGTALLFVVLFEAVGVTWIYGVDRFASNIKEMIGFEPNVYWKLCWKYVSPLVLIIMIVVGFALSQPLQYGEYVYPSWVSVLGWCIAMLPVVVIPSYALYYFTGVKGKSVSQRLLFCLSPQPEI